MQGPKFLWTETVAAAFMEIKRRLLTAPIVVLPDFNSPFEGIGTVLSQPTCSVDFFSEKLRGLNARFNTYDIEFYAIVHAIKHWRHYLFHCEFVLFTNHDALRHIGQQD